MYMYALYVPQNSVVLNVKLPTVASCNKGDFVQQSGRHLELDSTIQERFHNQGDSKKCSSEDGKIVILSGNRLSAEPGRLAAL